MAGLGCHTLGAKQMSHSVALMVVTAVVVATLFLKVMKAFIHYSTSDLTAFMKARMAAKVAPTTVRVALATTLF